MLPETFSWLDLSLNTVEPALIVDVGIGPEGDVRVMSFRLSSIDVLAANVAVPVCSASGGMIPWSRCLELNISNLMRRRMHRVVLFGVLDSEVSTMTRIMTTVEE